MPPKKNATRGLARTTTTAIAGAARLVSSDSVVSDVRLEPFVP